MGAALARLELAELFRQMVTRYRCVSVVADAPRRPVLGVYGVERLELELDRPPVGRS
jgi:cytochrome P450